VFQTTGHLQEGKHGEIDPLNAVVPWMAGRET
jgi:hypothetical protein